MSIRESLSAALKESMRAKEQRTVSTLRLIQAAIKDRDIAARTEDKVDVDDDAVILDILAKMIKQRKDSITAYEEGGRLELAEQEREEIEIIQRFLPAQMDDDAIAAAVKDIISSEGATGLKDMGRVMAAMKGKYAGQMDFAKASQIVKAALAG